MPDVVALALPGGPRYLDEIRRAWDDGHAIAPLDLRLPTQARRAQLAAVKPTVVVDETGRNPRTDGTPCEQGDAVIVTTSGTTGEPRAAVLTHDAVHASATATSARLEVDPDRDTWLACLPLSHIGGLGVVLRAEHTSTPVMLHDGFDAGAVDRAARDGATLVSLVPAVLDRIDHRAFRHILLGGSAIPTDRPVNTTATYGMTETAGGVVYDGHPLDGVELRAPDGEIQIRAPMLLRAYRDGTDPRDNQGWYRTGDAGTVVDGTVTVQGRIGDVIVSGGEKIWPEPVERALLTHPSVADCAVVGRPHPRWGHAVTALVVPATPETRPDLDSLRDHVKATMAPWCAPHSLQIVDTIPRTPLGKVRRAALD